MGYIKNRQELSTTKERRLIIDILEKTLRDSETTALMQKSVAFSNNTLTINNESILLKGKVHVIGAGKAAGKMAAHIDKLLGEKIAGGFVNMLEVIPLQHIKANKASHPLPTLSTFKHMKALDTIKPEADDIILFLLSGGASAMFALPAEGIDPKEFIEAQKMLVASGMPIDDINVIRKHISAVKGGRITEMFSNNKIYTLALSDIASGDISALGSGPTDCDRSTFQDAATLIKTHKLKLPKTVLEYIKKGMAGKVTETVKMMPTNSKIYVIGDTRIVATNASHVAEQKHLRTELRSWPEDSDADVVAEDVAAFMLDPNTRRPSVFVLGGELITKPLEKSGKGGRNQHFILTLLTKLKELKEPWAILAFNTDGTDFIKGVGGAVIDHNNAIKFETGKEDPQKFLDAYDSNTYLKKVNSLIKSDATGTNVCDIIIGVLGVYRTKQVKNNKRAHQKKKRRSRT